MSTATLVPAAAAMTFTGDSMASFETRAGDEILEPGDSQLGLTTSTIRQMIARGELPAVRPTRRAVRVPAEAVEAIARLGFEGYAATCRRLSAENEAIAEPA